LINQLSGYKTHGNNKEKLTWNITEMGKFNDFITETFSGSTGWENGGYVTWSWKGELEIVYPGIQGAVVLYSLMLSRHGIHTALWDQHCGIGKVFTLGSKQKFKLIQAKSPQEHIE